MKHNAANERVKREYFRFLAEAKGRDDATVDAVAKALARFEESTGYKDFKRLHREQAIAFKRQLAQAPNKRTGEKLAKATMLSTLRHCRDFFLWLAREPGYKSHIAYADADYFSLSDKDVAVARARREKPVPTLSQIDYVLSVMPGDTIVQRRDRALIAFTMLTGARVGALVTLRISDVDLANERVIQDARHVRTKFAKTITTWFMPVSAQALEIVRNWCKELGADLSRCAGGPLFPATVVAVDGQGAFAPVGLAREGWNGTGPVRAVFKKAFALAGLPYFNPHSFRDMLVRHAMTLDLSPEGIKALAQNFGHSDPITTLTSYGQVAAHRQGELIRGMATGGGKDVLDDPEVRALVQAIRKKAA
jgi:integrase